MLLLGAQRYLHRQPEGHCLQNRLIHGALEGRSRVLDEAHGLVTTVRPPLSEDAIVVLVLDDPDPGSRGALIWVRGDESGDAR